MPISKPAMLKTLLHSPGVDLIPEAYSIFAARLAEINGFKAIYTGGNMMSGLYLGIDDWGLIDMAELAEMGGRIARSISIPAIVDADQGGFTSLNVYRTVKRYELAGAAGLHIEDTLNPKHLGPGVSRLMPLDEMRERIAAAVEARTDPDFVIICRTDSMGLGPNSDNTDEMIRRGQAFAEAGGDAFFPTGIRRAQIDRITREVPLPLVGLNMPMEEVGDTGMAACLHAVSVYPAAMKLYETMIQELKQHGRLILGEDRRLSRETMDRVMDVPKYRELAERWLALTSSRG